MIAFSLIVTLSLIVTSAGLFEGESLPRMPGNPGLGRVPVTRMGYDIGPDDPKHDFDSVLNVKVLIH